MEHQRILLSEGGVNKMFIVNVEGAVYKNGKWLLIERSLKEEHAGGTLSLVGGKVEKKEIHQISLNGHLNVKCLKRLG